VARFSCFFLNLTVLYIGVSQINIISVVNASVKFHLNDGPDREIHFVQ